MKLTRGSLRILRERVPAAQRPRARSRALVRLAAEEHGWNNVDAYLDARYAMTSELLPSPFMRAIEEASRG